MVTSQVQFGNQQTNASSYQSMGNFNVTGNFNAPGYQSMENFNYGGSGYNPMLAQQNSTLSFSQNQTKYPNYQFSSQP